VGIATTPGVSAAGTAEGQDSTRRVKTVPAGTHHWFLCDECMLVGKSFISSASFDVITESELMALRYETEKAESHRWQIGEDAMLGYRRVRQCQEILYRLFKLKPYVMERWSLFAEQLLDIIENGSERFPRDYKERCGEQMCGEYPSDFVCSGLYARSYFCDG
jgi:hypothetical protein